ncbi:MAG: nucleotidyl transferase AbiEii/AbiGii toxin family protein [archaeon]
MSKIIDQLAADAGISNKTLLEKDLRLHMLLHAISKDEYLQANLAFKGGTCLIKCYLGYYRFSEDLDFTWIKQKEFENKSQKEIRRMISKELDIMLKIIGEMTHKLGLDFRPEKNNHKYVEFGGSNKFLTLKAWYESEILKTPQFIKIQVNFLEKIIYPFKTLEAEPIIKKISRKEFEFLFPEYKDLLEATKIKCYDLREILAEKARAILTRREIKARDFIDIFMILKKENIGIATLKDHIIEKVRFMMRYDKYVKNLKGFRLSKFLMEEEEKLLLKPLDPGFEIFLKETEEYILELMEELKK